MSKKKVIRKFLDQWITCLGLRWWKIDVYWFKTRKEVKRFKKQGSKYAFARCYADWRYGTASIHINLPAFDVLSDAEIEATVVHELVHVLVNEMQAGGMDHEERAVTGLTKAFLWTREGIKP
jgi:hypothetical protein